MLRPLRVTELNLFCITLQLNRLMWPVAVPEPELPLSLSAQPPSVRLYSMLT